MQLRSSAYRPGGMIPDRFTCDGANLSPKFLWSGVPAGTRSLALILSDPDAPQEGGFTHWILYDIDPALQQIDESVPVDTPSTDFGTQGRNDEGRLGYIGPCPSAGTQRCIARLYSLDIELDLPAGATRQELEQAIQGHILDQAALTGTCAKNSEQSSGTPQVAA